MKIPAITADPIAMFFEERKEEAELHEKQKEAVKKAWETLIHQEGFTGFQFKDHRGWTIYFHPSSREGIDWQLSYQGADGEFFSHADFLERTDDPKKGWNMRELYRELLPCSQRGREVEVTVLIDEREIEKGIENMAEKRNLTEIEAKSVAMHYAIGIDDAEKSIWQNITDYEPKEQETPTINASAFPKVAVLQTNGERSFQRYDENTTYSSKDYELVYWTPDVATLTHREDMQIRLNRIYQEMQWTMQPHDYYGHTLSTGDVLVLMENQDTYQSYLVDTVGFQKLPDSFLTQDMIHKIQYDLDIKQEYLMYQNLESLSAEKEEIKQLLSERTAQLKEYEPIFDLAEKRGIILAEQDKIETVYQYENKTQPENRLTFQEKVNNEAVLSMDVIRNVNATELRNLLNETYEKAVEENRAMETERLQSINQRMHEIGWEFVPSHLEEYGTYVYTANGKATLILESADAVEEWMTQRNLAWELDDYMHDLNPYDYKNRTGISYNGTAEERELQKEKLLEKIRKGDVADIVEQLSVYSTYSEENNKAITPYLNRLSTYLQMQEAQENDYQGVSVSRIGLMQRINQLKTGDTFYAKLDGTSSYAEFTGIVEGTPSFSYHDSETVKQMTSEILLSEVFRWKQADIYTDKESLNAVLSMEVDREAERAIDQAEVRAMGGELPIRGKEVAIESTEDYADQTFHQDTVDMAVENEDGTHGKTVHFYRIVEIGEDDRLHPLDDNQFTSYEEAKWMIEQNPDYDLISYDEMVHEVVQRMEINGDEKEDMISEKEPTIEGKKRIAAYIYEHNDGDQIWEDTTEFYADEHGNYVKQNADGWTQKKKIVSITYDEIIKDMEKVQSEVEEQRRIRENGGDYRGGYQITFNELENNSKEQSQNKSEIISEKLTAEDVKVLQGISISMKQSSRATIYQFECEIKGEKDRLTYELSQHDDSEGFTIHTEKNDVWERMEINELRKLEEVLSVEAEVLKWQERADGANTLERLQEVKNWWMESEVRLPEEQIKKITEILEVKGAELEKQKTYKYYSIHRPVSIGTYPKQGLVSFENYDNQKQIDGIGRTAWAELTYNRALTENEIKEYEFMEEPEQRREQEKEAVDQSSHREAAISAHGEDKTKSKQDLLIEQLHEGIQNMMNSEQYRNWLDTSSRLFSNNYSINNAILVFLQKQDASYTMGYEQWKEYGRNVKQGAKGIKILIPVMAYEKNQGALFKMIKNNLNSQLAKNSSLNVASYRIGKTSLEFTMNREETWGMKVNGKENGIFNNEQEVQKFIQKSILGKVPMYYSVGTVFDVKDTMIPETLWLKEGKFKKEELALAGDGKPRKNRKGEYEVVNTPERRAKFKPSLDMDIPQLNEKKMEQFFGVLKQVSENHNIPVTEVERESDETLKGGADGYFSRKTSDEYPNGYIRLPNDLDPTRKCAVMIHEMAHSRMHSDLEKLNEKFGENVGRSMRETQAESVAYVVGKSFGFETDSSSFQYIAAWSKGLELQEFQKSLNYINKEAKSLIQEIEKEIEDRGLNLEIHVNHEQDSLTQEDILKNGEEQAKGYIERALKEQDNILLMYDKVSEISEGDKQNPNMEALKNNVERQLENIDTILSEAEKMGEVRTKEEQDVCVQKIESAFQRIGQEQEQFQTLKDVGDLSTKFLNNPQKILDELSKDYEEVKKLTRVQKKYLERSPYVAEKLVPLLDENPRAFVDAVMERANMIASVSAKNGMFVEIEYCEQWTETPIFQKGTLAHPKVANMIVKEGEKQMEKLSKTAESKGEYFPYSKCKMIVFTPNKRTLEHQTLKVDIGDGSQKSLTDHMEQVYGKRQANFVKEFVSATRELKAKEKIYIPEKKIQTEKNQTEFEKPKPKEKPNFSLTAIEQGLEQTLEQIQKEKEAKQKEKGGTEKDSQEQTHDSDSNERC